MPVYLPVPTLSDPALSVFTDLRDSRKKGRDGEDLGLFIAESQTVTGVALKSGYEPVCALTAENKLAPSVRATLEQCGDIPVYLASPEAFEKLTGFALTRGMLCAMKRRPLPDADALLSEAARIAVLEDVTDATNMGAILRSAAALGVDAVLLSPGCCDPYCRRSLRVSMGTALQVPWTYITQPYPLSFLDSLRVRGFVTCAMALREDALPLSAPQLKEARRLAVLLGTEGTGLRDETIRACDHTVIIPMRPGVDSLNVAAASAVAFWELRARNEYK